MPRSAFLAGARGAGGTKTCTGAAAKQKTAEPQGAASLLLAVLESDGRKREGSSDEQWGLVGSRKARGKTRDRDNIRAVARVTVGKATRACARQSALGLLPVGGDSMNRGERRASRRARKRPQACGPRKRPAEKKFAYRRGESEPVLRANLRAAYWLPASGFPAFRMEVAAAKIRAALWVGISLSVFSQC